MKKDLKQKIISAFEKDTPDIKQKVINECEQQVQYAPIKEKKTFFKTAFFRVIATAMACLVLLMVGFGIGRVVPTNNNTVLAEETSVYLDVNPSIKISLDNQNKVVLCTAINQDGLDILSDLELKGVNLKTALNAIVGAMYIKGYLSVSENAMLISVETKKSDKKVFLQEITEQVNGVFENIPDMQCSIIAQAVEGSKQQRDKAKDKGVSLGKVCLVDKILEKHKDLSEQEKDALFSMEIKDLNLIYSHNSKPEEEIVTGQPTGQISKEQALNNLLGFANKNIEDIEFCDFNVRPSKEDFFKVVYTITIKFKSETEAKRYEIDCITGQVKESMQNPPPHNPNGGMGWND